jgi:hypothetical protein
MLRAMQSAVLWQKAPTLRLGLRPWFFFLVCICFAWRFQPAEGVTWREIGGRRWIETEVRLWGYT